MNIDIKTADGKEIELGGTYYDGRGAEYRPVGIRLIDYHRITELSLSIVPRWRGRLRSNCHARHCLPHPQAEG
jgi:hypothetical protein